MRTNQNRIDKLVERILNEEINKKSDLMSGKLLSELKGKQKNLDVAEPKGKLTAADFKKLRSRKKETNEFFFDSEENDEEPTLDYGGELGSNKWDISRVDKVKKIGSFDDKDGWYDDINRKVYPNSIDDYDEEEFEDFDSFYDKHGKDTYWFGSGQQGKKFFDRYKEKYNKPFRIRSRKDIGEAETEEGNAFTGKLAQTKKGEKFKLGGKTYTDNSKLGESKNNFKNIRLTEDELIDLIEKVVSEEIEKSKDNIKKEEPKGMKETKKSQEGSKKFNESGMGETKKKMKSYLKDGSNADYQENPKNFPKGNGELKKMDKKAFENTKVMDEFTDNFTGMGMENIVYDETHPDEEWLDDNIEGSSKTGNNNEWANAVKTDVNEKRNKIRKKNLGGVAKQMAYNKAPQPVNDVKTVEKKLNKNFENGAAKQAINILNQLESTEEKNKKRISEDIEKMKNLIDYYRKTQ